MIAVLMLVCNFINVKKQHCYNVFRLKIAAEWKPLFRIPLIFRGNYEYVHTGDCDLSALPWLQLQTWQCVTSRKKQGCTSKPLSLSLFHLIQLSVSSLNSSSSCLCIVLLSEFYLISKRLVRRCTETAAVIKCSIWWFFFSSFGLRS